MNLGDLYAESGQTWKGSLTAVSKPNFVTKYALESSRRDLHNALLCTALESNPKNQENHGGKRTWLCTVLESNLQKPGKTWKEKGLAKTTSGRDDQKTPVAAASNSLLQRDEWLRRKKPRGKKFQSNSVVFCCCCSVYVALYSGEGSRPNSGASERRAVYVNLENFAPFLNRSLSSIVCLKIAKCFAFFAKFCDLNLSKFR